MNSMLAGNINGSSSSINHKVASGSRSSLLSSSIDFFLTEIKTSFSAPSHQGKFLVKLDGKEVLLNGQNKNQNCDQNKNPIENSYVSMNGSKEKSSEDSIPTPKVQLYTGKIHVEWNQVYKIGAGLNNLGNTCFMNTVIQCLTYCPPLANYLLHDSDHSSKCAVTGFCMMCLLQRHMKRAIGKTGEVIKPVDVYQRLRSIAKHFQFGRQEDAHEFLRYVIDHLWKSCLPQTNGVTKLDSASKETTVINKIFGGYHRSQVICLRCKKESNTFDHFMDFILDIKQNVMTLEKALEKFIQPELLQQENSYKCPKCKMKVEAQKRFSVFRAPTVATFQLKRFDYNRSFGGKITKQVTYPERLNLRPYMSDPQGEPVWYRLNAVLVHSGPSCTSGHYFCYVKNSNGLWYIMDDQKVYQVSLNQVLNQSAYVLFYIKTEGSDRAPLKKCIENKNSFMKGSVSNSHFSKVSEMNNLKPSPLSEKVSPFTNSKQQFSSPVQVKKFNFSTPNREKISFGFRTALSSGPINPPKGKVLSSAPASTTSGGLVPYIEDSSESSDASESNQPATKQNSTVDNECKQNVKNGSISNYTSSPRLEIKTKLSTSVFNNSVQNFNNSLSKLNANNSVSKVSATGSWTVTDATETTSSSSSTGVNSTTDWQVINVKSSDSLKISDSKDSCETMPSNTSRLLSSEVPTAKQSARVNEDSDLSPNTSKVAARESSPSQKSNFRKQQQKFKAYFLENEETTENSFKRKCIDSHSKISKDSPITEHSENRYSPVPKKIKYTEKNPFMNGNIDLHSNLDISDNNSLTLHRQYATSNCDNNSRTHTSKDTSLHEDSAGVPTNSKNCTTFSSVSESVKTRISPEKDSVFPKVKHKEKSISSESSKSAQHEKKVSPIFNHLKGDSSSLYGTEVPSWRGDNVYRPPSIVPSHDNRRSFDDYDNEFDRGKVRKSKPKDHHYQYFHRKNPFQKHTDRYHNKYNGRFYNNHRSHKKPYDSHYNWKPNHDYQRYRNHHQRRY